MVEIVKTLIKCAFGLILAGMILMFLGFVFMVMIPSFI